MSQREHVGIICSLFCRCNKNSVSGSSSWNVWKIRYCAVHQPLFKKLIFKRWCYSVNDTSTLWEKRTQSAPIRSRTYFLLVIPHRFIRLPWRFASTQFILLSGKRHCERKVFCPRTQHSDLARTRTQTSRPKRITIRPHASPTSGLNLREIHT